MNISVRGFFMLRRPGKDTTMIKKITAFLLLLVMIASGITTPDDCYNVIKLGANGTGGTSGILNAPSPAQRVRDMAVAMVKAAKELEEENK